MNIATHVSTDVLERVNYTDDFQYSMASYRPALWEFHLISVQSWEIPIAPVFEQGLQLMKVAWGSNDAPQHLPHIHVIYWLPWISELVKRQSQPLMQSL